MEKKNQIIIIGFGNIARQLIALLPKDVEIIVVDKNEDMQKEFDALKVHGSFIKGDATSRLVLKELPVSEAECIIITTTSEETNIEVASLLKEHFQPRRVIAVGITPDGIEKLEQLSVEVESIFSATAIGIRNRLQPKTRAAHGIGIGKGEILEVEVHPHSRLANRPVGSLVPLKWKIGLILRGESIIIPRKDVLIKPGDRLILLGMPSVLKTVSELFTFSFQRFPLEYGTSAVVYITGKEEDYFVEELKYVLSVFPFQRAYILFKPDIDKDRYLSKLGESEGLTIVLRESDLEPLMSMEELFYEIQADQAMVIVSQELLNSYSGPFFILKDYRGRNFCQRLLEISSCPILIARGTFPYEKTIVPALNGLNFSIALEKAIEINNLLSNQVSAFLVEQTKYTTSKEEIEFLQNTKKEINELSLLYKKNISVITDRGNPIRKLKKASEEFNLIILGSSRWERSMWRPAFLKMDLLWLSLKHSKTTTIITPTVEEAL